MDTKEIIKKVKRIELKSRRKANNLFMGEYHSSFKGRGMIFSEIRPYQYGDDVRNIDWNKTAHFNEPYVKIFEEERELTMILMVDISASENFGTRKQLKSETVAEICATLAFSAITYNDKVGLILFSEEVELFIPPKKGKKHVLRIIRELVNFEPKNKATNFEKALEFLMNSFKRKANVFVLSDFVDAGNYERNLKIAAKKHDITGIRIYDEKETFFPNIGLVTIQDNETGEKRLINTSSPAVRKNYEEFYALAKLNFEKNFNLSGAGNLNIRTDEDYIKPLLNYFKKHSVK
ncbi:DUF58 domain-containing protein [Moheibacter sediminis]|uniref:DUF58 domain-containing protein n=1 Tax=Moheibacter sediminis TaxID=1434700 RepID=A0A1W1Y7R9_9FLAO|nr:DUF58 domain-containing protein [Moheibacter sediminis]SMC32250.1 Protein of unknown function DUF58 [Moheibacter sediminis]